MKILATLALSLSLISCGSLADGVDWVDYGENPEQNPKYMTDMMAVATPGPQHEALAARAGAWTVAGKMWMAPDTDSMPMNATATTEVVLGGRYIVEEFKSDFMGMPFEGRLTQGYDNLTEQYWCMWSDNMSTGCSLFRGNETSPGTVEFTGTATDILTPNGRPTRMSTHSNGDGTYTMKMFDERKESGEFQVMELHYKRR